MKNKLKHLIFLCIWVLSSCTKDNTAPKPITPILIKAGTYYGEPFLLNNVKIQSFINFLTDDNPSSIGLILPKNSIDFDFRFETRNNVMLPNEALIKTSFKYIYLTKGYFSRLEKFNEKGFLIYFSLKSMDEHGKVSTEYLKNGYNSPFFREPDKGIIPAGFKKNENSNSFTFLEPILEYVNEDYTLMLTSFNSEIFDYCVLISEEKMRNNPNISFTLPLTTQSGYFPTKISVIQTGSDIKVALEDLKNVK